MIDTRQKRMSAMNPACVWRGNMIDLAGIWSSAANRAAADYLYSGLFPATVPITINQIVLLEVSSVISRSNKIADESSARLNSSAVIPVEWLGTHVSAISGESTFLIEAASVISGRAVISADSIANSRAASITSVIEIGLDVASRLAVMSETASTISGKVSINAATIGNILRGITIPIEASIAFRTSALFLSEITLALAGSSHIVEETAATISGTAVIPTVFSGNVIMQVEVFPIETSIALKSSWEFVLESLSIISADATIPILLDGILPPPHQRPRRTVIIRADNRVIDEQADDREIDIQAGRVINVPARGVRYT